MAGGLGSFYSQALLDLLLGGTTPTLPGTWYAALFSAAPDDTGGGAELSGSGYARVAITNNATNFPASSVVGGEATKANGLAIVWPAATATWAVVIAIGFFDAATAGNLGYWGPVGSPISIDTGQILQVIPGNGVFTQG